MRDYAISRQNYVLNLEGGYLHYHLSISVVKYHRQIKLKEKQVYSRSRLNSWWLFSVTFLWQKHHGTGMKRKSVHFKALRREGDMLREWGGNWPPISVTEVTSNDTSGLS